MSESRPVRVEHVKTLVTDISVEAAPTKGSRFIAAAAPITSPDQALEILAVEQRRWRGATHHCFAWRLGETFRVVDDGEPSGTAGRPILRQIDARGLSQVIVVVSRYFGGTKLGTGGLIRAYGAAAAGALEAAHIVVRPITEQLRIRFPYEMTPIVERVLHAHAIKASDRSYDEQVTMDLVVPLATTDSLNKALRDACGGRLSTSTELTRS